MGETVYVFSAGEVCPHIKCEFRIDDGGPDRICAGAHPNRVKQFKCEIDKLRTLYATAGK